MAHRQQLSSGAHARGRERVLATAYDLFSRHGTRAIGVDRIIAESGAAKMTLYRNFGSKDDLILAFLERREERWTRAWLQAGVEARAEDPAQRLLAIFDLFGDWFATEEFEGCAFITILLEMAEPEHPIRQACIHHLAEIRTFLAGLAAGAVVRESVLLPGAVVRAGAVVERAILDDGVEIGRDARVGEAGGEIDRRVGAEQLQVACPVSGHRADVAPVAAEAVLAHPAGVHQAREQPVAEVVEPVVPRLAGELLQRVQHGAG